MSEHDLDDLAAELAEFAPAAREGGRPAREERIIAGFEDIQRFFEDNGRAPKHGDDRDIFERLYAVRLDRLRSLPECLDLLAPMDRHGLLSTAPDSSAGGDDADIADIAAELGEQVQGDDVTVLKHVRPSVEKRAAEEIGQRTPCADFDAFKPSFERVRHDLKVGVRKTRAVHDLDEIALAGIQQGEFLIVDGQLAYIAEVGQQIWTKYGRGDRRLRVIYDNGTESDVLQRSFQRALYRDETARLVITLAQGPLFSGTVAADDQESGTIYVVRSRSDLPLVAAHRDVLHKIGVTGQSDVAARFSSAKNDPTFLLADVEIVATYDLYNINRTKLENLIHRVFGPARLEIEIKDRFGKPVVPREWFLVPIFVVNEAIERIKDGTIAHYVYDPASARLVSAMDATAKEAQGR